MPHPCKSTLAAVAKRIGAVTDVPDLVVSGITHDSRRVTPGDLFVCITGFTADGHAFAPQAVERGAVALVVSRSLPISVPQIVVPNTRQALGLAAAELYADPSRHLRMIGVTGTKGKTTTTYLTQHLLAATGQKVGLIGTIQQVAGDEVHSSNRTTPEASDLQALLYKMVQAKWNSAVMEVSSHAVELQRTTGTEFDVAVFTNIARDHLDFHPDFAHYLAAKTRFFQQTGVPGTKRHKGAVVNVDDPHWEAFANAAQLPLIKVGLNAAADMRAEDVNVHADGVLFRVTGRYGEIQVKLQLTGLFNVYNALCALAVAVHEGVPLRTAAEALAEVQVVPGRFERVDAGQPFMVVVDYAHTPESLESVLTTARTLATQRVIVVAGAGGDRDRGKRPLMGEAMAKGSDFVIVTSDNPRSEEPIAICKDIVEGIETVPDAKGRYEVIVDRRAAIHRAIEMASAGDLVLIAGKGHETYQQFADHTIHFDDREEALAALRQRA